MKYKLPVAKRELQKIEYVSGSSLFLGQTEVRRAEKKFCFETVSPPPPPTLSPGLHDRTLKVRIRHCM